MFKLNAHLDDPGIRPLIRQGGMQSKSCRRLVVVCAETLMRTALMELFRVHFGEADLVEASRLSDAVPRFQEAEDAWLIVHFPTVSPADFEMLQSCSAIIMRRLVILRGETAAAATRRGIEAGASGILSDRLGAAEVVSAMGSIFEGKRIVKFECKRDRNAVDMEKFESAVARLKPRSRVILDLLCDGRSTREIAAALGISLSTAKWHVGTLLSKLELSSRFRVVAFVTRLRCSGSNANGRISGADA